MACNCRGGATCCMRKLEPVWLPPWSVPPSFPGLVEFLDQRKEPILEIYISRWAALYQGLD